MSKLTDLLRLKDETQALYDAACKERQGAITRGASVEERVRFDIIRQRAVQDSVRADHAYTEALRRETAKIIEFPASADAEIAGVGGLK